MILVVCTGNACRSPMAAAILEALLRRCGVDEQVVSAGTAPWKGGPTGTAVAVMRERGLNLDAHGHRAATRELLERSDLVLCMERAHTRVIVERCPDAERRTFVIGELARRDRPRSSSETIREWAERIGKTPCAINAADEVADPVGGPIAGYRRTARLLETWLTEIVALLAARTRTRPAALASRTA